MNATVEHLALSSAIRCIQRSITRIAAIITEEKNQRIFFEPFFLQKLQHVAHIVIHTGNHRQRRAAQGIFDMRKALQVGLLGLHRFVGSNVRNEQEERLVLMTLNEVDRFATEGIGRIGIKLNRLHTAVHLRIILRRGIRKIDVTVLHPVGFVKATLGRI